MMKTKMVSVFDTAVGAYTSPQFYRSIGEAERAFRSACSQEGNQFNVHAKDYSLMLLGEFDDNSGQFTIVNTPSTIITALQAKAMEKESDFKLQREQDGVEV